MVCAAVGGGGVLLLLLSAHMRLRNGVVPLLVAVAVLSVLLLPTSAGIGLGSSLLSPLLVAVAVLSALLLPPVPAAASGSAAVRRCRWRWRCCPLLLPPTDPAWAQSLSFAAWRLAVLSVLLLPKDSGVGAADVAFDGGGVVAVACRRAPA